MVEHRGFYLLLPNGHLNTRDQLVYVLGAGWAPGAPLSLESSL